jgi:transketolase
LYAAHHKIDNLISFVDWNGQQIDGTVEDVMNLGDLEGKWRSFGWHVLHCDGHDLNALDAAFKAARAAAGQGKPVVVLMKTDMGRGVDFMEGTHKWHGVAPDDGQLSDALHQLATPLSDY